MKQTKYISITGKIWIIALIGILLPITASATDLRSNSGYSASGSMYEEAELESDGLSGPFDGYDLETRKVWINDTVYRMHPQMRVLGTPKKLGLLTDIEQGEIVKITVIDNDSETSIPIVTEIVRL